MQPGQKFCRHTAISPHLSGPGFKGLGIYQVPPNPEAGFMRHSNAAPCTGGHSGSTCLQVPFNFKTAVPEDYFVPCPTGAELYGSRSAQYKNFFLLYNIRGCLIHVFFYQYNTRGKLVNCRLIGTSPYRTEISVKLFFKDFYKNFKLFNLINLKRKGKY